MLTFEQQNVRNRNINISKRNVRYWIITFNFNNVQPIEFKVRSLPEFANVVGIPIHTLKKIIYDNDYNTKKYIDFLKYTTFQAVY